MLGGRGQRRHPRRRGPGDEVGAGIGLGRLVGGAVDLDRPGPDRGDLPIHRRAQHLALVDGVVVGELLAATGRWRGDHVSHDDGDVVQAAALVGGHDQVTQSLVTVGDRERLVDRIIADQPAQPVGAEQDPVALFHFDQTQVRLRERLPVEHLEQQGAVRMETGLGFTDASLVDQRLDEGVVVGQPLQDAAAAQVAAGIADMDDAELGAVEQGPADGGSHPVQGVVVDDQFGDPIVGALQGPGQGLQHLLAGVVTVGLAEFGDGDGGGQITRGGTTHAVRDHDHGRGRVPRVLVVLAHQPDLGVSDRAQLEWHQGSSLIWVRPILMSSEVVTTVGVVTRTPLTKEPLVEPRSVRIQSPLLRRCISAWSPET